MSITLIFFVFSTGVIRNFLACLAKFSVFIRTGQPVSKKRVSYMWVLTVFIYIYMLLKKELSKKSKRLYFYNISNTVFAFALLWCSSDIWFFGIFIRYIEEN